MICISKYLECHSHAVDHKRSDFCSKNMCNDTYMLLVNKEDLMKHQRIYNETTFNGAHTLLIESKQAIHLRQIFSQKLQCCSLAGSHGPATMFQQFVTSLAFCCL